MHESLALCGHTRSNVKHAASTIAHPLLDLTEAHHSREKLKVVNSYLKVIKNVKLQLDYLDANIHTGSLLKATDTYCSLYRETFEEKKYQQFAALQVEITRRLDSASLFIDAKLNSALEKIAKSEFNRHDYTTFLKYLVGFEISIVFHFIKIDAIINR